MISVNMATLWSDNTVSIVQGVTEATENIIAYRSNEKSSQEELLSLGEDIGAVCDFWTGKTYVGSPKSKAIKDVFQKFFVELINLLLSMKDSEKDYEVRVAEAMLYRGTIYRYLGHNHPSKKVVIPQYNEIYVSWSKKPENDYIESKLYGPVTWMSCKIAEPLYGIDLDVIGSSRASEHEVVFPTIEEYITEIKYISEENDD